MREKTEAMLPAVAQVLDAPERLGVLQAAVPDMSVPDEDFDGLARLAASLFDAPIALVSLEIGRAHV